MPVLWTKGVNSGRLTMNEFVATEPDHEIVLGRGLAQMPADDLEDRVAG